MMKRKFIHLALLCLFYIHPLLHLKAQDKIKVGSKLPVSVFNNVLNYKDSNLSLKDFEGKYIIIDFWNTLCLTCIKSFPKIDSVQQLTKNEIQFIMVNKEPPSKTKDFFQKWKGIKMPDVPYVTSDTSLRKLFNVSGDPFSVWLDKDLVIRYITRSYNLTPEHLYSFINGKKIEVNDLSIRPKYGNLFNFQSKGSDWPVKQYSYLSGCINELQVGYEELTPDGKDNVRLSANCRSVVELYQLAYGGSFNKFTASNTVLQNVADTEKYLRPADPGKVDQWSWHYAYNYDLSIPKSSKQQGYDIMKEDLRRYFNLHVEIKTLNKDGEEQKVLILRE